MRAAGLAAILAVGIIWGALPHLNKHGIRIEGITSYTAKRHLTSACVLLICAFVHTTFFTHNAEAPSIASTSVAVVSGVLTAGSLLAYMWCLSEYDASVVVSGVYVLGLTSAVLIGAHLRDEALATHQRLGVCASILACSLLSI